ncbi:vWA domain-containing protein [Meridianimarinicoccus sp. RP-17]|uniref:vWA domain-containing protein n=1 Tax=Meridianimarinicoccus zhengii TaxID=2056810 RepID=UPI000DADAFE7|nr:VWA-like domain-containing protein [Phycocomes zhengii]
MTAPAHRATRALAHLGEVDPALAVLALWCRIRDGDGATRTAGDTITIGPGFDSLGLPEQVGLVAHHVLHVALRHSDRQAALAERLGDSVDPSLFGLAADGIVNETLILAGHAIPRPAVTLTELLDQAGIEARSAVEALERWDTDRLAMALHADPKRAQRLRDWGKTRGFSVDLAAGTPDEGRAQSTADWRNHVLRALEAGRKAGTGIGRLGAFLADLAPDSTPWEIHLRGLLARALTDRPRQSWRRPSGAWIARIDAAARHGGPTPVFEPGTQRMDHRPRIVVGLDTSSSIDPQTLRLFTTEARAIARRTGAETHLMAFDTEVFQETRLDPDRWNSLQDLPWRTGGGTDYADLFARAARIAPSIAVILTDLDAPLPPRPRFPVLWAVPRATETPPWGRTLRIGDAVPA